MRADERGVSGIDESESVAHQTSEVTEDEIQSLKYHLEEGFRKEESQPEVQRLQGQCAVS